MSGIHRSTVGVNHRRFRFTEFLEIPDDLEYRIEIPGSWTRDIMNCLRGEVSKGLKKRWLMGLPDDGECFPLDLRRVCGT